MSDRVYAHTLAGRPESSWEPLADHLDAVAERGRGLRRPSLPS